MGAFSSDVSATTHSMRFLFIPRTSPKPWGASRGVFHSPSLNSDKITDNKDFKKWIDNYLGVGEWVMDQSVAVLGSTSYFERKR
ncbi:80 kD MCM3-associated protein [Aspergillus luchuensis]|uniref:80 kD MCM3-associated protein n=1 Tax=Aspergillus kawachii TaxID=1069201 RepID=A0A146F1W9_ASPKA|nr:80 kD MCM3-associated protein [Aspergillus luchuensis]